MRININVEQRSVMIDFGITKYWNDDLKPLRLSFCFEY